jgi:hypothetical protein
LDIAKKVPYHHHGIDDRPYKNKAHQFACPRTDAPNSGNGCSPENPYVDLKTYGCSPDENRFTDCCNSQLCDYVGPDEPDGIGHQCDEKQFNDMATALLVSREHVIVSIMVDPTRYSMTTLFSVGMCFFVLMSLTYGSAIPAGVFIPTIMVGTCFGGLAGRLMMELNGKTSWTLEDEDYLTSSPYALIGAVALLGGVQRSSLSLVVIILEGTGAVKQLMPIILTTVVSKWVGDSFNEGLYHTALELKHIPFLEPQERRRNRNKSAQDVMTPAGRRNDGLVMFDETETVHNVLRKLVDNKHNGFPVLRERPDGRKVFVGLVLRNQAYTLIAERHFASDGGIPEGAPVAGGGGGDALNEELLGMYKANATFDDQRTRETLYKAMVQDRKSVV